MLHRSKIAAYTPVETGTLRCSGGVADPVAGGGGNMVALGIQRWRWIAVLLALVGVVGFSAAPVAAQDAEVCVLEPEFVNLDFDEDGTVSVAELEEFLVFLQDQDPAEYDPGVIDEAIAATEELLAAMEEDGIGAIRYAECEEESEVPGELPEAPAPPDNGEEEPVDELPDTGAGPRDAATNGMMGTVFAATSLVCCLIGLGLQRSRKA